MKRVIYILLSVCLLLVSFADVAAQTDKREVRKGNRRFKEGEYTEAQVEYLKGLAKDSLSIAANYNMANTFLRQEDYANAEKALARVEEAAVASADGAAFYYNQGAVAIAQKNWQKAVEAFAKSLMINPDDLDAKENYRDATKMLQNQQQNQNQQQDQNQQPKITPQAAEKMLQAMQEKVRTLEIAARSEIELNDGKLLLLHHLLKSLLLPRHNIKYKLIMNLQNHSARKIIRFQTFVHVYHCNLYNIGGGALNGSISCNPFTYCTEHSVGIVKFGQISSSAEKSGDKAVFVCG